MLKNNFPDYLIAWVEVALVHSALWAPLSIMFGLFLWQGWLPTWIAFYIEHVISNLNWIVYAQSVMFFTSAAITGGDVWAYVSMAGYIVFATILYMIEYNYGTDAIRYLDNDYYLDPKLVPSLFYLAGLTKHIEEIEEEEFVADKS